MTRILIDGNSLLNAALLGGVDHDHGQKVKDEAGKDHQVNGWLYGTEKFFDEVAKLCERFNLAPRQMVVCWDGMNSKMRRRVHLPQYKEGRDKLPEISVQLNLAREACTQGMLDLGAHVAQQDGYEADDVLGYLVNTLRGERNIIATSDGDLSVLVDENTDVWRLGEMNKNPYGPFPHKYITLYKALVGDSSDKIPGAKGFGDVAWVDLVRTFKYEGLDEVQAMIIEGRLDELKESVGDLKCLQKILDAKPLVQTSWRVASLLSNEINTMQRPLEIKAGMVKQWVGGEGQHPSLKKFYGTKTLVTAGNYVAVYERLAKARFEGSPFVALDIETSSSDESDEWQEALSRALDSDRQRFDTLGHELTGMSLTFGNNTQHTVYMSVDHTDTANITVDQCREVCELIPHQKLHTVIQNRDFEFQVLYRTWGEKWKENGWGGFVPNAIDTKVGSSYVDENLKKGLKDRSLHHLGYTQQTFEEVTTKRGLVGSLSGGVVTKVYQQEIKPPVYAEPIGDELVDSVPREFAIVETWETRSYKMKELSADHVFDYASDDTQCTAALHTHYKFVMDLEHTWDVYMEVEQLPQYLTSLAFVQGVPMSMPTLVAMEKRDDEAYDKAWATVRKFLMGHGWDGTVCPEFEGDLEPSDVKLAVGILLGELNTKKRKLNGMALDIRTQFPGEDGELVAAVVEANDVKSLNAIVKGNFTGEPQINFGSPKQLQHLFYEVLGLTPRLVNKMTAKQRQDNPDMVNAFRKRRAEKEGKCVEFTPSERAALISKSSTDDAAVDTALALDKDLSDEVKAVLNAYKVLKKVLTRRNLFYKTYRAIPHWRDGRLHPSLNQSEAHTRRYSASAPNIQQLPARGEGARFREIIVAHHKDAVVVSLDFKSQELLLAAEYSGDPAMTSCFAGDNKRDMHSLAAISAAPTMWGREVSYDEFQRMRKSADVGEFEKAKKLREDAKKMVFASQYGAMAPKLAETMMCSEEVAQAFLDARKSAFPKLLDWDAAEIELARSTGYSTTMMGARRHLRDALASDDQWERSSAERQVGNFKIQGSAAEQSKLAMAKLWASGAFTGRYDAQFMFAVHDEVVLSVHRDQAADLILEAHALVTAPYADMKLSVESSIAIGRSFACEGELGTVPDRALIEEAIRELFIPGEVTA